MADEREHEDEGVMGAIRDSGVVGMGVGAEDPNIIGDAKGTDVPPGSDPPAGASDR